ncbi:MAG: lasso RiPP family leader peptide-containing protein [Polyangiaceae bacterium]|nr:lasso RiPP family leader peptide-containing protein [Polyangiaceae bacterium]
MTNPRKNEKVAETNDSPARRAYTKPQLTEFGDIADITQSGPQSHTSEIPTFTNSG